MCGIAGVIRADAEAPVAEATLRQMAGALRHRGPDGFGLSLEPGAGLVSTRLAIFDVERGWQPLETGASTTIVYNGEVYNHPELRAELSAEGERFETECDTEVVLRLLARDGLTALDRFNGQFALALWEPAARRLTLIRDRFGVRPLYFATPADGSIVFGSEAKAIFASGLVEPRADLRGLDEVFTLWGPRPPRSPFANVFAVRPGGIVTWERGSVTAERLWWTPAAPGAVETGATEDELEQLLRDSVRLRLRADVPVGTYLSGGLDSSLITALAQAETDHPLHTFSIAFGDAAFDERAYQEQVASEIGTEHHAVEVDSSAIATALPAVIRHTESPLVRTAPVPMYLLAQEVRAHGITVVATGEGADELFWGYDLFKEIVARGLVNSEPERAAELLDELYPYLGGAAARRGPAWRRFMLAEVDPGDPLSSHLTRARSTAAIKAFYRPEVAAEVGGPEASLERLRSELPPAVLALDELGRAAWLELTTLLEPYLLSVQADRVAMASGVEGRYPFLDHRVFDYAARLPPTMKLDGLKDKIALRELANRVLPAGIARRPKQPYRAPGVEPFFGPNAPGWVDEALGDPALEEVGIWDPAKVAGLLRRCREGRVRSPREEMTLVAVLSTQVWHREFIGDPRAIEVEPTRPRVRLERAHLSSGARA